MINWRVLQWDEEMKGGMKYLLKLNCDLLWFASKEERDRYMYVHIRENMCSSYNQGTMYSMMLSVEQMKINLNI